MVCLARFDHHHPGEIVVIGDSALHCAMPPSHIADEVMYAACHVHVAKGHSSSEVGVACICSPTCAWNQLLHCWFLEPGAWSGCSILKQSKVSVSQTQVTLQVIQKAKTTDCQHRHCFGAQGASQRPLSYNPKTGELVRFFLSCFCFGSPMQRVQLQCCL